MRKRRRPYSETFAARATIAATVLFLCAGLLSGWQPVDLPDAVDSGETLFDERWQAELRRKAESLRIPPVNARVDRVWKAIPGYNGLEVDLDATLAKALENPRGKEIPFVFKEIEPDIKLADLPPSPIYRGNPHKPAVSFMINVAWGNEYVPELLRILREEGGKATFFLDGSWLSKNRDLALRIRDEGHELSNHAYSHQMMSRLGTAAALAEIRKTEQLLGELGVQNRLFAPPAGDYDDETVRLARQEGLYTVLWTLDTVDWRNPDPAAVITKINSGLEPGALVLMHPTAAAVKALPAMIRHAKSLGYAVDTVSAVLDERRLHARQTDETHHSSREKGRPGAVEREGDF